MLLGYLPIILLPYSLRIHYCSYSTLSLSPKGFCSLCRKLRLEELQWLLAHSLSGHQTLTFQAHHLGLLTFDKFQSVLTVTASVLSIHHLHSVKCGVDWILQLFLCKYVSQSRLFHTTPTTPTISCEECSRVHTHHEG